MSSIPATLNALVALAERAWPDVQVLDGGPTTNVEHDVIEIGYSGSPTEPDVRSTMTVEQLTMEPDRESYDVMGMVSAWRGDAYRDGKPDARTARERAFEMLGGLRDELAKNPQLDGLVMLARMSTLDLMMFQTGDGPVCTVRFVIHVDAYAGL